MSKRPRPFRAWPPSMTPFYGPYRAILDEWKDADTGVFLVDLGYDEYDFFEIRLAGYSSPEKTTPEGRAAWNFAKDLAPTGCRALLHSVKNRLNPTLTRFAARIVLECGLDFGEAMHAAGHARPGSFEG